MNKVITVPTLPSYPYCVYRRVCISENSTTDGIAAVFGKGKAIRGLSRLFLPLLQYEVSI
jgi:hypothetical protein